MTERYTTPQPARTIARRDRAGGMTYINPDGLHREPLPAMPDPDPRELDVDQLQQDGAQDVPGGLWDRYLDGDR